MEGTKPMAHRPNRPARASNMAVPRTTASRYRKHTYSIDHTMMKTWMPYASVVQDVFSDGDRNNSYYHEMKDGNQSFEREEHAYVSAAA